MTSSPLIPVAVILGPTAVGKSALALELAQHFNVHIVSADSQQVYRGLDIGTAKPTMDERQRVRYHLVDIVDPDQPYDAGRFMRDADAAIEQVIAEKSVPLVVGGTGFYLRALEEGLAELPSRDEELRAQLEAEIARVGAGVLHQRLQRIDPISAQRIHSNDRARLIRLLEIATLTGRPPSEAMGDAHPKRRYRMLKIGLELPREELCQRIDARVLEMCARGWLEEVRALLTRFAPDVPAFRAVGYREIVQHLRGEHSWDETVALIQTRTRQFAKRQMTWFRADADTLWFAPHQRTEIAALLDSWIRREYRHCLPKSL